MPFRLDGATPSLIVIGLALLAVAWRQGFLRGRKSRSAFTDLVIACLLVATTAFLQWEMGRPLKYLHGPIRLWSGNINSDQNSQQIADPYTFTHVVHGAAFYGLTRLVLPSASLGLRAITAVAIEEAWEAYENTDTVVERYRKTTISLGYYGDSVLNSACDVLACLLGFFLTRRLPKVATWSWTVAVEVILAFWIRDNLTLNIVMLLHPFEFIRRWQAGG
ncbi:MAG: DUF2585 family protein [Vicinamibacterales bacterium]